METKKVAVNHVNVKWPVFRHTVSDLHRGKIEVGCIIFKTFYLFVFLSFICLVVLVALGYIFHTGCILHLCSFYLNFMMVTDEIFIKALSFFLISVAMCFVFSRWYYKPITYSFEFKRNRLIYTQEDNRGKVSKYYFYLSDCKLSKSLFSVKLIVHKGFLKYHIIKISKRHVDDVTRLKIYKFLSQGV